MSDKGTRNEPDQACFLLSYLDRPVELHLLLIVEKLVESDKADCEQGNVGEFDIVDEEGHVEDEAAQEGEKDSHQAF